VKERVRPAVERTGSVKASSVIPNSFRDKLWRDG
jgi:hypothetical protein